jgi:DNA-binding transcriptional LysR family regulator
MYINALKCLLYIVEDKSISKAAKRVHISQSALSQMIQKLEEDIGYELLIRSNKGVSLTPRGEIAMKYVLKITKDYDTMMDELKFYDVNHGKIQIAGTSSLSAYSLPCLLYRIKKKFPQYQFQLSAKSASEIVSEIKDGMVDFGFVDEFSGEDPQLSYFLVGQERIVLIAKADYPIKDVLTREDVAQLELIMCNCSSHMCQQVDEALNIFNYTREELNVIFDADSLSAVKSSVLNGYGTAFVPYESVKHELYEKSIKILKIENMDLEYGIYLVSKKPTELSPSVSLTREYLIEIGKKSFC